MLARRRGGIITVDSAIAFRPSPRHAAYGAANAFALALSEALRAETRGSEGSASSRCARAGRDRVLRQPQ